MQFSEECFELQIRFARTAARLIRVPLEQALLDYTNLYVRFGLGRAFDSRQPAWRQYIDGLNQAANISDWTYRFYLARAEDALAQSMGTPFGCFPYVMQDAACVRIHFHNAEPAEVSPLDIDRLTARFDELRSLFLHVKRDQPEAMRVVESKFCNMPLWGQFLDRHGLVRKSVAQDFKRRLSNAENVQDLADSFPVRALAVEAPIALFFNFCGLDGGR